MLLSILYKGTSNYYLSLRCFPPGRGESNLELARLALQDNFDGRAVDYVTLALRDITM